MSRENQQKTAAQPCGHPVSAIRPLAALAGATTRWCAACVSIDLGRCPCAKCLDGGCHVCGDSINLLREPNLTVPDRPSRAGTVRLHSGCVATHNQREVASHAV